MNKTILIIDSAYLCYRAMYSLKDLNYNEQKTGVIFGFLNYLLTLSGNFKTNKFIFAWDSKRSVRKRLYPAYKGDRQDIPDDMKHLREVARPQRDILKLEVLPQIGFVNNFQVPGLEADDVIAKILYSTKGNFVVVANDSDLYQLLLYCRIYNPATKQILTKEWFVDKYGIQPYDWYNVKAIAGCDTDKVAGIFGVGEATAIKYITNKLSIGSEKYKSIISKHGQEIIKRNLPLVKLPFNGMQPIDKFEWDKCGMDGFMEVCNKYGFSSFINTNKFEKWKKLLGE